MKEMWPFLKIIRTETVQLLTFEENGGGLCGASVMDNMYAEVHLSPDTYFQEGYSGDQIPGVNLEGTGNRLLIDKNSAVSG